MNITQIINQFGVSKKQADIFILCHHYGQLTGSSIARLLKIPRSTANDTIKKLIEKGLIIGHKQRRGFSYSAIDFEQLLSLLEQKRTNLASDITYLQKNRQQFEATHGKNKFVPTINYYQGVESLTSIYAKYISSKENYGLFDLDTALAITGYDLQYFISIGKRHTGFSKEIMKKTENTITYSKQVSSDNHLIKFLPNEEIEAQKTDYMLYDGKFAHISFGELLTGFEVDDSLFFGSQKIVFEALWKRL